MDNFLPAWWLQIQTLFKKPNTNIKNNMAAALDNQQSIQSQDTNIKNDMAAALESQQSIQSQNTNIKNNMATALESQQSIQSQNINIKNNMAAALESQLSIQSHADLKLKTVPAYDKNSLRRWKDAFILRARSGDIGLGLEFAMPWVVHSIQTLFPSRGFALIGPADKFDVSPTNLQGGKKDEPAASSPDTSSKDNKDGTSTNIKHDTVATEVIVAEDIEIKFTSIKENNKAYAFSNEGFISYRKFISAEMKINQASSGGEAYRFPYAMLKVADTADEIEESLIEEQSFIYKKCLPKNNPWFISLVSVIQLLTLFLFIVFGGFTRAGILPERTTKLGVITMRGKSLADRWSPSNVWVGPEMSFLIRHGALYHLCLKRNNYLFEELENNEDYSLTESVGCCLHTIRDTSLSATEEECRHLTENRAHWQERLCSNKLALTFHLRPCCYGSMGHCLPLLYEDCQFFGGTWFPNLDHCSEINCFEGICGIPTMSASLRKPFLPVNPNQFWRMLSSLFIHAGILHALMVILLQWLIGRSIEQMAGSGRLAFVYLMSGIGGNYIGGFFSPHIPILGGSASLCGLICVSFLEIYQAWHYCRRRVLNSIFLGLSILIIFFAGTFPFVDNFANLGGLLLGGLSGLIIMPHLCFNDWSFERRTILRTISFVSLIIIIGAMIMLFYLIENPLWCGPCRHFSCASYNNWVCSYDKFLKVTDFRP